MPELTVLPASQPSALVRLIDDYQVSCRARGLSPKTINNCYGYPLREVFIPWCAEQGIAQVSDINQRALDRLSTHLLDVGGKKGKLSKTTVHSYLRAVNHFIAWARKEGEAGQETGTAHLPKLPRVILDVLERSELQAMEDAADSERDKLIVRILADTGIRVGELVGLRTTDLVEQGQTRYLRVGGKTGERLVPIPALDRRIRKYIERGRRPALVTDRLFVGLRRGRSGDYEPLTESGVEQLVRELGDLGGVKKRVYPHLLRHSYATWALRKGMNPLQLQQILGHSSLQMISSTYSHLVPSDAHAAMIALLRADAK